MDDKEAARLIKSFGSAVQIFAAHLQCNTLNDAQWQKLKKLQDSRRDPEPGEASEA